MTSLYCEIKHVNIGLRAQNSYTNDNKSKINTVDFFKSIYGLRGRIFPAYFLLLCNVRSKIFKMESRSEILFPLLSTCFLLAEGFHTCFLLAERVTCPIHRAPELFYNSIHNKIYIK